MKQIGKISPKQTQIFSTYQWLDFILVNNISPLIKKENKILTQKSFYSVYLDGIYYGLDIFLINRDKRFPYWDFILYLNQDKKTGILVKQNSLRSKYQIAVFH